MSTPTIEALQYPIGIFESPAQITTDELQEWIYDIELFPVRVRELTLGLSDHELNWTYRPDGWSIKQLVHHCADSHMNSLMRFKLCLTEDEPAIRPYFEDRWAELTDSLDDNIRPSLELLGGLHYRWTVLMKSLSEDELERVFFHPENGNTFSIKETIGNYAWHCNHHLAHIKQALTYKGQFK